MTFCSPWPPRWPEIESAIRESISTGDWGSYFSQSQENLVAALKEKFGVKFVRLCCSGTAALEMSLRASNIAAHDEVITAAFDYPGNVRCIEAIGAIPVLLDVEPQGSTIRLDQLAEVSGSRIRAVIASHLYGRAADIVAIRQICDERGWILIEDACQVPGMRIEGVDGPKLAGSFGHVATLSFGGSKPLTAGNGGAILTSDERVDARLKRIYDRPSDTLPLSSLQAAVLLPQLTRLDELNRARSATVSMLSNFIRENLPAWTPIALPDNFSGSCFYKFAFLASSAEHRAKILDHAIPRGLPLGEGFRSMHRMSDARCRKPFLLESAKDLGDRCCVLDHRALMIEPNRHAELCDLIRQVYELSM